MTPSWHDALSSPFECKRYGRVETEPFRIQKNAHKLDNFTLVEFMLVFLRESFAIVGQIFDTKRTPVKGILRVHLYFRYKSIKFPPRKKEAAKRG